MFRLSRLAALSAAGASTYLAYDISNNQELVKRNAYFWSRAFPVYMHYRWTALATSYLNDSEQDIAFNVLHDKYAPIMDDVIRHLRGFYIKIGQLGSTREDFLPEAYLRTSRKLQNDCPTEPFEIVKKQIEKSLKVPISEVFSFIEEIPLGTASIGQTHRATLKDGTKVVVKVQLPDAEEKFKIDMKTIIAFCGLAQPAHLPFLYEIERQFLTEFDYVREAENLELIRNKIIPVYGDRVVIPKPFKHLCRKEVLVMEELEGDILSNVIRKQYERIASSKGMTLDQLIDHQAANDRQAEAEGKERERGASALTYSVWRLTSKVKRGCWNVGKWVLGEQNVQSWFGEKEELPINIPQILDLILEVHGHELFVDGAFNGDPHPGNIMMLKDGRLGLIDYGQVKILPKEMRLNLARLCLAIAQDDMETAVDILLNRIGLQVKDPENRENLKMRIHMQFNRDDEKITGLKNAQAAFERVELENPVTFMPDDVVMPFRLSLLMRGVAFTLRYPIATAPVWAEIARKVLEKEGEDVKNPDSFDGKLIRGKVTHPKY
eukprot:GDKJ01016768.1.p1 GENE.GDKJ01016768.1~~GDKJ01016768.1.p1  ORF type:complete len:549 (-),score=109.02 GDKJ01016768.1:74-1720(-)